MESIEAAKGQDLEFGDIMPLVMGKRGREAEALGDADGGIWSAGQSVGLIEDCPPCAGEWCFKTTVTCIYANRSHN